MASTSLRFRIEGDNTQAMRALSEVKRGVANLGSDAKSLLGEKLKTAMSVVVIEEAVRRTAEWSLELKKSSQELNISVESMQALRLAAEKANLEQGKIFNYYNKIESAALKALNGNKKLADSFKALGISEKQLKTSPASTLLETALKGGSNKGGEPALLNIFGSKEVFNVRSLQRELGGRSIEEYGKAHESQIMSDETVSGIAASWENITDDLKSLGNKFSGVVTVLLQVVDGVLKMANGIVGTLNRFNPFSKGGLLSLKGMVGAGGKEGAAAWDETVIRGATGARALANLIPQMGSGIVNLFGGKTDWKWVQSGKEAYGNAISEESSREAEGAAEGAFTMATMGAGPVAKLLGGRGKGVSSAASVAGKFGVPGAKTAGKFGEMASKLGLTSESGLGEWASKGLLGKPVESLFRSWRNRKFKAGMKGGISSAEKEIMGELGLTEHDFVGLNRADSRAFDKLISSKINALPSVKRASFLTKNAGLAYALGFSGQIGSKDVPSKEGLGELPKTDRSGRLSNLSGLGSLFTGGSGNLSVGGTFGADLQGKIATLNEKQLNALDKLIVLTQQVVNNTSGDGGDSEPAVGN